AYYYLGKCENLMGDYEAAENYLRTSLELVPDEPDYMIELAMILEKVKRDTEAKTLYRKAGNLRKEILKEEEEK
ncbi:MAG: tetratricopeptide repeat protein, partial [Candidatus Aegiribacteria sp.]|nr:tetratricopeptide repeat protein [Candidatus Aegiribacteria sp.]MBD3294043.1 tetratricopeptide repeat protein [Candidatus Fermentibacteria bacterium]